MSAVLGGDPDEVARGPRAARAHRRQRQRRRPGRRRRHARAARRPRGRPAGQGPGHPAAGRRRVPHRAHGAGRRRRSRGYARGHHDPRPARAACCPTRRRRGRRRRARSLDRLVAPGQQPGALGPVHGDASRDLGVTGLIELAAGRHARRPGQARPARRRDRSPSRPRTTSTPARDAPRARRPARGRHDRHLDTPRSTCAQGHRSPRRTPTGAEHARIWGVGGYRPERVVPNAELVERDRLLRRVDPRALRHHQPPLRRRRRVGRRHGRGAPPARRSRRAGLDAAADRRRHRRHGHPPLPDPGRGAHASPTGSARPGAGVRHLRRLRRLLPRHRAGQRPGPRRQRRATSSWSASRSCRDFTDPHRPRHRVHLRRRRRRGRHRPVRHPRHRPDGLGLRRRAVEDASRRRDTLDSMPRRRQRRALAGASPWQGQTVFRWAVWGMAPVAQQALDAAGVKADDLDAFIPHQANMRIIDAMVKQLQAARRHPGRPRHRRRPATPRRPRSRSRPSACCARARPRSGGLALQIGFGAGLVYAAQVVVLP